MSPAVAWMARHAGANVTLLHVADAATAAAQSGRLQADLVEYLPPGSVPGQVRYRVVAGADPAAAIVEYAAAHEADLIMMPTHGLGFFRRAVIGSVTEAVLRNCECAVWTDTHPGHPRTAVERVLCHLRLDPEDGVTLSYAQDLVSRLRAQLVVCYAVPETTIPGAHPDLPAAWRRVSELLREGGVQADVIVAAGRPEQVIRYSMRRSRAGLLIASRGLDPWAYDAVRAAAGPVLIRPTRRAIGARIFRSHAEEPGTLLRTLHAS